MKPRKVELADVIYGLILGVILAVIAYELSGLDAAMGVTGGLFTALLVVSQSKGTTPNGQSARKEQER